MLRLFVAIPPPEAIRDRLLDLEGGVPGARWVEADNLHLTLRFLGEVDEPMAADLDAELARLRAPAFEMALAGVDCFGSPKKPATLWAGVDAPPALGHLRDKVDRAAVAAGFAPERRKFKPHVTLARLKDAPRERLGRWLAENGLFRTPPFTVDRFALYRSDLRADGPVYTELAVYPLEGAAPAGPAGVADGAGDREAPDDRSGD
jgi:2'-5' RNA ligase